MYVFYKEVEIFMWEKLTVYHALDKKEIGKCFKLLGNRILENLYSEGFSIISTTSTIKIFKVENEIEFSVFLLRQKGGANIDVKTCIKPFHFLHKHKFTMTNIVSLGAIVDNHRQDSFPLTQEYEMLADHILLTIKNSVVPYFEKYNSWKKIIKNRRKIDSLESSLNNSLDLLIYAAIWTKERRKLLKYLNRKLERSGRIITQAEFFQSSEGETDEIEFYKKIKDLAERKNISEIQSLVME